MHKYNASSFIWSSRMFLSKDVNSGGGTERQRVLCVFSALLQTASRCLCKPNIFAVLLYCLLLRSKLNLGCFFFRQAHDHLVIFFFLPYFSLHVSVTGVVVSVSIESRLNFVVVLERNASSPSVPCSSPGSWLHLWPLLCRPSPCPVQSRMVCLISFVRTLTEDVFFICFHNNFLFFSFFSFLLCQRFWFRF